MSSKYKKAVKKRASDKAIVVRHIRHVEELTKAVGLEDAVSQAANLRASVEALQDAVAKLESSNDDVVYESNDDAGFKADVEQHADFMFHAEKARMGAVSALATLEGSAGKSPVQASSAAPGLTISLPKLELPKFGGDVVEWSSFWDSFNAAIGSQQMPSVRKLTYLQSLLKGEAAACIEGLAITDASYPVACDLLEKRFGRKERIIFAHLQALLAIPPPTTTPKAAPLRRLFDELQAHVRSLQTLGIDGATYGVVLTPILLSRLPSQTRMEWARDAEGHEQDLKWLLEFLRKEIERRERSETFDAKPSATAADAKQAAPEARKTRASAAALNTRSASDADTCGHCNKRHATAKCFALKRLPMDRRRDAIKNAQLCFRCLGHSHMARTCEAVCSICRGGHHALLCPPTTPEATPIDRGSTPDVTADPTLAAASNADPPTRSTQPPPAGDGRICCLQTARVSVKCSDGRHVPATVLLDSGSDRTYVSTSFVQKTRPRHIGSIDLKYAPFGGRASRPCTRSVFELCVTCYDYNACTPLTPLTAVEVPVICAPLHRQPLPPGALRALPSPAADDYGVARNLSIDILVGLDNYWSIMSGASLRLGPGLVAQESVFGWVLSGSADCLEPRPRPDANLLNVSMLCMNASDSLVRSLWELDGLGITPHESVEDDGVLKSFNETVCYDGERYQVALPWNGNQHALRNNRAAAERRLISLQRKLRADPSLASRYASALQDFESAGFVEGVEVTDEVSDPVFYLPHRPVVKESSETTKVRPVFDASARGPNGLSLNDCMHTGPSLLPSMIDVLIRFRRHKVALSADISKAFLQIRVRPEDRDAHRFLVPDAASTARDLRFTRVPFGNKASPFLLNATLRYHLSKEPPCHVVDELSENLYVDDWLSGADSVEDASLMFAEAREILGRAGMPLNKWNSNERGLLKLTNEYTGDCLLSEAGKILGVRWAPESDSFLFDGFTVPSDLLPTKRVLLSCIARLYDPLGFMAPVVMTAKILFQDVWRFGASWDDPLQGELAESFTLWLTGLQSLRSWRIPRRLTPELRWVQLSDFELHACCDASEKAYGAAVYLRYRDSNRWHAHLVISRARVAPLKRLTLPRLELLGALLAARLLATVNQALHCSEITPRFCWTDSMVVLGWIKGDPSRWKQFVANRVREIHDLTPPAAWHHIPGTENPADLLTRGASTAALMSAPLWLNGPDFGALAVRDPPVDAAAVVCSLEEHVALVTASPADAFQPVFDADRFSSYARLNRVAAYVMRFARNCRVRPRERNRDPELSSEELQTAERALIAEAQRVAFPDEWSRLNRGLCVQRSSTLFPLSPFLDEKGIMRKRGRLEKAHITYAAKHPVILAKCHFATLMVRSLHVRMKHAGVSAMIAHVLASFWILGLRRLAKRIKHECVRCARFDARACDQLPAPLPAARVQPSVPFAVVGLDYAGPVYCSDFPGSKFYILLITCAVVRAVHLELTASLSLEDFLLAFRRFCARRGSPTVVYSDNARTFKGAAARMHSFFPAHAPEWRFIAPASPWWGGFWERLVRSVKSCLRKSLGRQALTRSEMETSLIETEGCLNSRPLTVVSGDEPDRVLTPNHFLVGKMVHEKTDLTDFATPLSSLGLQAVHGARAAALQHFWRVWSDDYLKLLPPLVSRFRSRGAPGVGSIVLVRDHNSPRLEWPLGRVEECVRGRDGLVRTVKVKTSSGTLVRAVQNLHDLEVMHDSDSGPSLTDQRRRTGRLRRAPDRLDV